MAWQLQEAKQRFSEVVRQALEEGPQLVTRHGREAVVVLSAEAYRSLEGAGGGLKEYLRAAPDLGRLRLSRDPRKARVVKL